MQTKFISIIRKLLANKFVIFGAIFITSMAYVSSNYTFHIEYYDGHYEIYPPQKKSKYKKIYCTSEDRRKGIKTTIDYLHAACGRSEISPLDNRTLKIERFVTGVERLTSGDLVLGHHILYLKEGDKVLQEMRVENEGYDPFWREVVFVKIRKNVYWQDLNKDGYPEFAVLKTDTGNEAYRSVQIYTLKENVFSFYGEGKYVWTTGEYVLFNCPKCCMHELEECKKCT